MNGHAEHGLALVQEYSILTLASLRWTVDTETSVDPYTGSVRVKGQGIGLPGWYKPVYI
jgi:hypothetical protein